MNIREAAELLQQKDNILILTHRNPDGDTVGSSCALCSALRRIGKTAYLYNNRGISGKYSCYIDGYIADEGFTPEFVVAVDVAAERMLPEGCSNMPQLCIDHHSTNSRYAEALVLDDTAAACGEIILELIERLCGTVTSEEATALYLAVSTDTGRYLHGNTNAATYKASARLYEYGADIQKVNTDFFKKSSMARIKLEGMIYSSMNFYYDGLVVTAKVTLAMLEKSGARPEDLEDLANLPGRVEGCRIAVLLKEQASAPVRVSVRTEGYSAAAICSHFGGGGHEAASGCSVDLPIDEAETALLSVIGEYLG